MNKPSVAVVVLNWNGRAHLEQFLPSVVKNLQGSEQLFIADNASSDDSLEFLELNYPNISVIKLDSNYGFAGGYNRALAQIDAEYFVLLNSDVEVTPDWIDPVLDYLESHKHVASAQPKILSFAEKHKFEYAGAAGGFMDVLCYPFCRGRMLHNLEADIGQYDNPAKILWATGACMFVRSAAFREAGGFDERFFAHMEEIDLCLRLHRLGYEIAVVPESKVYHLGGGTLSTANPRKTFLNFRNSLWMMAKNWPAGYFYPLIPLRLTLDGLAALSFLLQGNISGVWAVLRAHLAFYVQFLNMRRSAPPCSAKLPEEILMGSMVLNFYLNGKRRFFQLKKYRNHPQ